jgi:hypothetical protein
MGYELPLSVSRQARAHAAAGSSGGEPASTRARRAGLTFRRFSSRSTAARRNSVRSSFGIVISLYQRSLLSAICDLFPDQSLATALGLSGNISVSIFGGPAALVITWLIAATGSHLVPAVYLMAGGLVGLLGTLAMRYHRRLPRSDLKPAANTTVTMVGHTVFRIPAMRPPRGEAVPADPDRWVARSTAMADT